MRLLTPPGVAGVAVVAIEDGESEAILAHLVDAAGAQLPSGWTGLRLATLRIHGMDVDEVLLVRTGEGEIELHVHGSAAVLAALHDLVPVREGDPARSGRASNLLATALAPAQLDLALEQARVDFATFQGEIDGLDPASQQAALEACAARSVWADAVALPFRVVLAGLQNAGKSTLFNHLLGRERVLVGAQPGLTRDAVAEVTCLDGYPYELVDTAGEGEVADPQDQAALGVAREARAHGMVVWVSDGSQAPSAAEIAWASTARWICRTKVDQPVHPAAQALTPQVELSCRTMGSVEVRQRFGAALRRMRGLPEAGAVGGAVPLTTSEREWFAERLRHVRAR